MKLNDMKLNKLNTGQLDNAYTKRNQLTRFEDGCIEVHVWVFKNGCGR